MQKKIFVAGSSGFIGGHLVRKLKQQGHFVVGADIELPKYEKCDVFYQHDLRIQEAVLEIFNAQPDFDEVYLLACLMGGMGFIGDTKKSYEIMIGSTQIISNILDCCVTHNTKKVFYSSSACAYNMNLQDDTKNISLKEADIFPAMPDLMYGWQKLFGELMMKAAHEQYGLNIRIARFHNIFGHEGIYDGGKEKAPAALSRKIAKAKDGDTIEVWGDGKQVRSFLFINECLEGVEKLMQSDYIEPINIGSSDDVSIKMLANILIGISGKKISIAYDTTKPQGVRGRSSDNKKIKEVLSWRPSKDLKAGLEILFHWVDKQVNQGV